MQLSPLSFLELWVICKGFTGKMFVHLLDCYNHTVRDQQVNKGHREAMSSCLGGQLLFLPPREGTVYCLAAPSPWVLRICETSWGWWKILNSWFFTVLYLHWFAFSFQSEYLIDSYWNAWHFEYYYSLTIYTWPSSMNKKLWIIRCYKMIL